MVKLKKWFEVNKLSLNLNKTKCIVFANRRKLEYVSLCIDGVSIEKVSTFRFLGVIMSKSNFVLNKAKYVLDYKSMHILYFCLILPYLNYCVEVWGNTFMSN